MEKWPGSEEPNETVCISPNPAGASQNTQFFLQEPERVLII